MGQSANAILFYGFCWNEESDKVWTLGKEDGEDEDDSWEERFMRLKGLPPPEEPFPQGRTIPGSYSERSYTLEEQVIKEKYQLYWEQKSDLVKTSHCLVDSHCHYECPMPYVAIKDSVLKASSGDPEKVTSLATNIVWDIYLREFCSLMGIDVTDMQVGWWLVSEYS